METREELLRGLKRALELMQGILTLQNQQGEIQKQYKKHINHYKKKKEWQGRIGGGNGIVIWIGLTLVMINSLVCQIYAIIIENVFRLDVDIAFRLAWIPVIITAYFLAIVVKNRMNNSIRKQNAKIDEHNLRIDEQNRGIDEQNAQIKANEQLILQKIHATQVEYTEQIAPWYPEKYCYIEAIEFFVNMVENYRADTLKEAINLYEDTMHKNRMELAQKESLKKQEELIKQQKLANLLAVGNLVMQAGTQSAINQNTAAVNNAASATNRVANTLRDGVKVTVR